MYRIKPCLQFSILALSVLSLPSWAADLNAAGIPNFHQVNEHVYRGGQPADYAWQNLAKLGVKTIVDLRLENEHSAPAEARAVQAAGMKYISVPMKGVVAPSPDQIAKVLALLDGSSAGPVFVHCRRGADRTGTVIACYRIAHDRWGNKKALSEAKSYGMSWTQLGLKHFVMNFRPPAERAARVPEPQPAVAIP